MSLIPFNPVRKKIYLSYALAAILLLSFLSSCATTPAIKAPPQMSNIVKEMKSVSVSQLGMHDSGIMIAKGDYIIFIPNGSILYFPLGTKGKPIEVGPEDAVIYRIGERGKARPFAPFWVAFNAKEDGKLYFGLNFTQTDQYGDPLKREYKNFSGKIVLDVIIFNKEDPQAISDFLNSLSRDNPKNHSLEMIAGNFAKRREIYLAELSTSKEIAATEKALSDLGAKPVERMNPENESSLSTAPKDQVLPTSEKTLHQSSDREKKDKTNPQGHPNNEIVVSKGGLSLPPPKYERDMNASQKEVEKEKKIAELTERLEKALKTLKEVEEKKINLGGPGAKGTAQVQEKPKIAVWDLEARNTPTFQAKELTSILVSEITKLKKYEVYSQDNVRTLAGWTAQRMQIGCTDSSCLTALGQMDIDKLISGSVGKIGNRYSVSLNLFDTLKVKAANAVSEYCQKEDELIELIQQALSKLLGE